MRVTAGLDSGPIALQEEVPIAADDDYGSLSARLAALGGELAVRALDRRASGGLDYRDQDESRATYAEKIDPAERRLDSAEPAAVLERRVRALTPHIGAYLELEDGVRLGVRRASVAPAGPRPGELRSADGRLLLGAADGSLRLDVVQPPGKRPMEAEAYLRGHEPPARVR
jgi:methionyl-tRNA formyltransferase